MRTATEGLAAGLHTQGDKLIWDSGFEKMLDGNKTMEMTDGDAGRKNRQVEGVTGEARQVYIGVVPCLPGAGRRVLKYKG